MRLWDYRLLKVLPDKMIVSQWRECIAIKRQWEKGTLKHRLVSYVMDHKKDVFYMYVEMVVNEMKKRNIKYKKQYLDELREFAKEDFTGFANFIRYSEHNDRYLKQCLYNLQEKHDRGIISDEEWEPIKNLYWDEDDKGYI